MMIYDCFTFFNEIDVLKLRLDIMDSVIDRFVIVEANKTQKGVSKPFYFELHKDEFSDYLNKIIYIKVEDCPVPIDEQDWVIEFFQRNCILRGLNFCNPEDLILISDLDEIVNPDLLVNLDKAKVKFINTDYCNVLDRIKQIFLLMGIKLSFFCKKRKIHNLLDFMPLVVQQSMHYYFINYSAKGKNKNWYGTIITKYKNLQMPQKLRDFRNKLPLITMKNAGWHFSYLGGKYQIRQKLDAIMEGGLFKTPIQFASVEEYIDFCLVNKLDIFNRKDMIFVQIPDELIGLQNIATVRSKYANFFV